MTSKPPGVSARNLPKNEGWNSKGFCWVTNSLRSHFLCSNMHGNIFIWYVPKVPLFLGGGFRIPFLSNWHPHNFEIAIPYVTGFMTGFFCHLQTNIHAVIPIRNKVSLDNPPNKWLKQPWGFNRSILLGKYLVNPKSWPEIIHHANHFCDIHSSS